MNVDPQDAVDRARAAAAAAEALLTNPVLRGAFARLEAEYTEAWRGTAPAEAEAREDCWRMLAALDRLKREIGKVAEGGAVAAHNHRRALRSLGG